MRPHSIQSERYEVVRPIGAGGMGIVYEARDRETGELCALKTLSGLDGQALYRFKNEFRSLCDLSHPNLVRLYELVGGQGAWFFTMELVDGSDFLTFTTRLGRRRPVEDVVGDAITVTYSDGRESGVRPAPVVRGEGPTAPLPEAGPTFDVERLRSSVCQLTDALEALHAYGHVHRDLKSSNVMVTREGRVVLLDFGLVTTIADGDASRMTDNQVVGTVSTMAPEQALGAAVSPAADWYALGAMVFQAMTGRMPFEGSVLSVLCAKQTSEAPDPRELAAGVPDDLARLTLGLLTRDPATRFAAEDVRRVVGRTHLSPRLAASPAAASLFVGRASELSALRSAFHDAEQGRARSIVLAGEAGIGKSSLVRRFLDEITKVRPDVAVLTGRCHAGEAVPFKSLDGVIDGLSHALKLLDQRAVRRMAPPDVDLLCEIFPVLARVPALSEPPVRSNELAADERRSRAFGAFRALIRGLAEHRPTIVVVEDLQRGDRDGLLELGALQRGHDAPRMLFLATVRTDAGGLGAEPTTWRRSMPEDIAIMPVPALDPRAALHLFRRTAHAAPSTAWDDVVAGCEGHPLHILEVARCAEAGASARALSYEDALAARLDGLDPLEDEILTMVSVSPLPLAEGLVADALGTERAEVRRAVEALVAARLLTFELSGTGRSLEPHHERIASLVRRRVASVEMHAILGVVYDRVLATEGAEPNDDVRLPFLRLLDDHAALTEALLRAAERARVQLAFERAARLFLEAVGLGVLDTNAERAARAAAAECLDHAGCLPEAATEYGLAAALEPDPLVRAEWLARAAQARACLFDVDGAKRSAGEAMRLLGASLPTSRIGFVARGLVLALRALVAGLLGRILPGRSAASEARYRARHAVFIALQMASYLASDTILGFYATMGVLHVGFSLGSSLERVESHGTAAVVNATLGWERLVDRAIARCRADADAVGGVRAQGKFLFFASIAVSKVGRFDEMERLVERARTLGGASSSFEFLSACSRVGWLHAARGRYDEAASWYERSFERTPDDPDNQFFGMCRDVQAAIDAMRERANDARARHDRLLAGMTVGSMRARLAIGAALVLAREDDLDEATVDRLLARHAQHVQAGAWMGDEEQLGRCAAAYVHLDRALAADPTRPGGTVARTRSLAALRAARADLRHVGRWHVHAPHLPIVDAALEFLGGRSDEALRALDAAEALARAEGHAWAAFEASLVRAHVHHARGEDRHVRRALAGARAVLAATPAPLRARRLERIADGFGLEPEAA